MNFEKLLGYQVFKNHICNDRFKLASSKFVHQYFFGFSVLFLPYLKESTGGARGGGKGPRGAAPLIGRPN